MFRIKKQKMVEYQEYASEAQKDQYTKHTNYLESVIKAKLEMRRKQ